MWFDGGRNFYRTMNMQIFGSENSFIDPQGHCVPPDKFMNVNSLQI